MTQKKRPMFSCFTFDSRKILEKMVEKLATYKEISIFLKISPASVGREVRKGGGRTNYTAEKGQAEEKIAREKCFLQRSQLNYSVRIGILEEKIEVLTMQLEVLEEAIRECTKRN